MALNKHNFDKQEPEDAEQTSLTLNISLKLLQRIERLATQQHLSVSEYLEPILDTILPETNDDIEVRRPATRKMLEELQHWQNYLVQEQGGGHFDNSVELLHQIREERSQELESL